MTTDELLTSLDSDQTKALNTLLLEQRTELQVSLATNEADLVAAHAAEIAQLQADKAALETSLTHTNVAHAAEIKTLGEQHTTTIADLNAEHGIAVQTLADTNAIATTQLNTEHTAAVKVLTDAATAKDEAMAALQTKMGQAKAEVVKTRTLYTDGVAALANVLKLFQSETATGRNLQRQIDRDKALVEKAAAEAAAAAAQQKIEELS